MSTEIGFKWIIFQCNVINEQQLHKKQTTNHIAILSGLPYQLSL